MFKNTSYVSVTWRGRQHNNGNVLCCDALQTESRGALVFPAISANLSNYWTVSRFVARVYVLFLKLNNFAVYCAASRFLEHCAACVRAGRRERGAGGARPSLVARGVAGCSKYNTRGGG